MLGTPNLGSYEAVRWLTGFNPTRPSCLLDITQTPTRSSTWCRATPACSNCCPSPRTIRISPTYALAALRRNRAGWDTAQAADLQEAAATWKFLREAPPIPAMAYVAGCQPATVIDYQLVAGEVLFRPDLKRLNSSPPARATAPWPGPPGACPACRCGTSTTPRTTCCAPSPRPSGYLDILVNGQTTLLPSSPPARARAGRRTLRAAAPPPADGIRAGGHRQPRLLRPVAGSG
jgi:hypothetical protein